MVSVTGSPTEERQTGLIVELAGDVHPGPSAGDAVEPASIAVLLVVDRMGLSGQRGHDAQIDDLRQAPTPLTFWMFGWGCLVLVLCGRVMSAQ